MSLKDHCTRVGWLAGLPLKKPAFVVHELQMIMGFIGYPVIYHTDNDSEVKGAQIIAMLKDTNPSIVTVTGRVRQPSDQGSVEVMNSSVKVVIRHFETEVQQHGQVFCWSDNLGKVMAALNKSQSRGKYEMSPYKSVFGMDYDQPLTCTMSELRAGSVTGAGPW